MKNSVIRDTVSDSTASLRRIICREAENPVTVRKKFAMSDCYFRKSSPENELLSYELAFDVEFCFWVLLALGAGILILKKAHDNARIKSRIKSAEKRMKMKHLRK